MCPVRQPDPLPYRLSLLWLLSRPSGPDRRRQIMWEGPQRPDSATDNLTRDPKSALTYKFFILHYAGKTRKIHS
jgi:hypothetical protein